MTPLPFWKQAAIATRMDFSDWGTPRWKRPVGFPLFWLLNLALVVQGKLEVRKG